MKKLFLGAVLLASTLVSFCQSSDLAIISSTDQLTSLSEKIGVTSFDVVKSDGHYDFTVSANELMISNEAYTLQGKRFLVDENDQTITLNFESITLFYTKSTKQIDLGTRNSRPIMLELYDPINFDKQTTIDISMALIFFSEITDKTSVRVSQMQNRMAARRTGIWVTYNGGASSSTSQANTQSEVNAFLHNNPNCHLYGTLDTSCLFDNHVCVSSQHYQCT